MRDPRLVQAEQLLRSVQADLDWVEEMLGRNQGTIPLVAWESPLEVGALHAVAQALETLSRPELHQCVAAVEDLRAEVRERAKWPKECRGDVPEVGEEP